jgi:hypothetical protein
LIDDEFKGRVLAKLENIEFTQQAIWDKVNPLTTDVAALKAKFEKVDDLPVDVAVLKTKVGIIASVWGGIWGLISGIIILIVGHFLKK